MGGGEAQRNGRPKEEEGLFANVKIDKKRREDILKYGRPKKFRLLDQVLGNGAAF